MKITPPQLRRLQTLYTQFEAHSLNCPGKDRTSRLQWAAQAIRREIASFSDLTRDEAVTLIDTLQRELGVKVPNLSPRKRPARHQAEKMGTEGRRDQKHAETTLAGVTEFAMLQRDLDALGWSEDRLKAFLLSPKSPTRGRAMVRTLGDANRVHWALKRIHTAQERRAS